MVRGVVRQLVATKLRIGLVALLVVGGSLGGGFVAGLFGTPSVAGVSNNFAGVSEETTTIETELVVNNPNPVGVTLGQVTVAYAVDLNEVRIAKGSKEGVAVGSGNSTISLSTGMHNGKIPAWWVSHLRNGEHSELVVHATVTSGTLDQSVEAPKVRESVDTDISSSFNSTETRPIQANREPLVQDPVIYVNETRGWWGEVTSEETTVDMRLEVYNPKPYAVPVQEVRYDVGMNGIDVGSGGTDRSYVVPPGETRTLAAELTIDNDKLDDWWVSHLQRNQVTSLEMELSLVVDFSNVPGGGPTVTVPLDTLEHTIETDIFGNKAEYPTGESAHTGDDSERDGTATETVEQQSTDGDDDTTGDATGDQSPTPSPTPTDDGGIFDTPTDDGGIFDTPTDDGGIFDTPTDDGGIFDTPTTGDNSTVP